MTFDLRGATPDPAVAREAEAWTEQENRTMFSTKVTTFSAPAEPIVPGERYLLRLEALEDLGPSKFARADDPDPEHRVRWIFAVHKLDGSPLLDIDGGVYRHHDFTSNRTGRGIRTAIARQWMEALIGQSLEENEIKRIHEKLPGKVAVVTFEERTLDGEDGSEPNTRVRINRMGPYTGSKVRAAPTEPVARPVPTREQDPADGLPF